MVPPIWPDEEGRPLPTYPCPRPGCSREVPFRFRGFRVEQLRHVGWQAYHVETFAQAVVAPRAVEAKQPASASESRTGVRNRRMVRPSCDWACRILLPISIAERRIPLQTRRCPCGRAGPRAEPGSGWREEQCQSCRHGVPLPLLLCHSAWRGGASDFFIRSVGSPSR